MACTENLTPWRKIVPTGSTHGLAVFLNNPHHIQKRSIFWSIGFDFRAGDELVFWQRAIVDVRLTSSLQLMTSTNARKKTESLLDGNLLFGITNSTTSSIADSTELSLIPSEHYSLVSEGMFSEIWPPIFILSRISLDGFSRRHYFAENKERTAF